eukprot:CAMPEP_0113453470 /NCGR_PEP_ID=MMETSP0014_2-20120614/7372_1 /TAXON_ID=2857 /ORGANISM="Nitzschia sp." /LENGTH=103 /DNA_ID=CAMNT_0000344861 /DNA_START=139 /DNA_END=450 /DNA_ORIENTATION=- /assembly_acc=CAM_ASM_000159
MKSVLSLALILATASAVLGFAPSSSLFGVNRDAQTSLEMAKHVNDKAAKWAKAKRPRKSRPSDINRTPPTYEIHSFVKPAEYTVTDAPASIAPKPSAPAATEG